VIGGGLVGVEVVEAMLAAGLKPRFVIREEWFWPMAIDRAESAWIAQALRAHGVEVDLEHDVEAFEADDAGNVARLRTSRGVYDCDLAVVAIGVVPNAGWLSGSPVALERGAVVVDAGLQTATEGIFAAGDCAGVMCRDGRRRPEQLWYTARDQGRLAGRRLLGDDATYDRGLWYNSAKLMDIEYTTAGFVGQGLEGEREFFYEETGRARSTTRIVTQGDRVVGFNLLGRRWDHEVLLRWITERRSLKWVLARLKRAAFDTEFVPPLVIPRDLRKNPEAACTSRHSRG